MKVLKGLVLTMLVSTATIFPSAFEDAEGLNNFFQQSGTGSLHASTIIPDQAVKTSIALSSTEAAATILARLIGTEGVGEETSTALSTVLNMLDADTSGAIRILQGLASGGNAFTGSGGSAIQDVLDVLTSEVASAGAQVSTLLDLTTDEVTRIEFSRLVSDFTKVFSTFNISNANVSIEQFTKAKGDVTDAYNALRHVLGETSDDSSDDLSAIVMGIDLQRQSTVAASSGSVIEETAEISQATRIEFSHLVSDFTAKLKTFNPFTVSTTSDLISTLTVSVAGAYDALSELVDYATLEFAKSDTGGTGGTGGTGDVVGDLSLSVMGLDIGTSGLQRQSSDACGIKEVDEGAGADVQSEEDEG